MGGKDPDNDAWPEDLFRQMKEGHEKFMRELQDEGRSFQRELDGDKPKDACVGSSNPFVSFKNFIDANLSALADNFRRFPANIVELKAKMQEERERRKQEEWDVWSRWTGIDDSPDHVQMSVDRCSPEERKEAVDAASMLLREAQARNEHVSPEKIVALYRDDAHFGGLDRFASPMLSEGGACYYKSEAGGNLPSTAQVWRWPPPSYRWLSINWFKLSPYSPITLEDHSDDLVAGHRWRAAFEDLINASLDKPMTSVDQVGNRPPYGRPQSTNFGPGLDWTLSLQCRGILPPQLPSIYNRELFWRGGHLTPTQILEALLRPGQSSSRTQHGRAWDEFEQLVEEISTPAPPISTAHMVGHSPCDLWPVEQDLYGHESERTPQDYREQLILFEQLNQNRLSEARGAQDQLKQTSGAGPENRKLNLDDTTKMDCSTCEGQKQKCDGHEPVCTNREPGGFLCRTFLDVPRPEDQVEHTFPPTQPPLTASQHAESWLPSLTGDKQEDQFEAQEALYDALDAKDVKTAAECLNAWQEMHGSVDHFISDALRNIGTDEGSLLWDAWHSTLLDAMKEGEAWRQLWEERAREDRLDCGEMGSKVNAELHELEKKAKPEAANPKPETQKKVDILSSLTTTQTTRLPDGTVTTKVVLKQRFADGREETQEKVHTYQEPYQQPQRPHENQDRRTDEKKKGWFWT